MVTATTGSWRPKRVRGAADAVSSQRRGGSSGRARLSPGPLKRKADACRSPPAGRREDVFRPFRQVEGDPAAEQLEGIPLLFIARIDPLGLGEAEGEGVGKVGVGDDRGACVDIAELAVGRFGDAGDDLLALADRLAHLHPLLAVVDLHIEDFPRLGGDDVAGVGREDDGGIVHLMDVYFHPGANFVDRADRDAGYLFPDAGGHLPGVQRREGTGPVVRPASAATDWISSGERDSNPVTSIFQAKHWEKRSTPTVKTGQITSPARFR